MIFIVYFSLRRRQIYGWILRHPMTSGQDFASSDSWGFLCFPVFFRCRPLFLKKDFPVDELTRLAPEQREFLQAFVTLLPDTLWPLEGPGRRSGELTPLYIQRFCGEHRGVFKSEHPFWEFIFTLHGECSLDTDSILTLKTGTGCFIPPGTPHRELSVDTVDTLWVGIDGSLLKELPTEALIPVNVAGLGSVVEDLWLQAERAVGCIGPLLDAKLRTVFAFWLQGQDEAGRGGDLIADALRFLNTHFSDPITVSALANRFGYSEGHFYRTFRARTGQTPLGYLNGVRMNHARRWLEETRLRVDEIARRTGYSDPLYFSRAFRKHFGSPPTAIRREEPAR